MEHALLRSILPGCSSYAYTQSKYWHLAVESLLHSQEGISACIFRLESLKLNTGNQDARTPGLGPRVGPRGPSSAAAGSNGSRYRLQSPLLASIELARARTLCQFGHITHTQIKAFQQHVVDTHLLHRAEVAEGRKSYLHTLTVRFGKN